MGIMIDCGNPGALMGREMVELRQMPCGEEVEFPNSPLRDTRARNSGRT